MVRERSRPATFYDAFIVPDTALPTVVDPVALFPTPLPVELDIGCGRGRFLLARAVQHPQRHFVGIDRISLRLRKLDRRAVDAGVTNIRLIRGDARGLVCHRLKPSSVSVFYVFFPDPWPKRRHHHHRLVDAAFANGIHQALQTTGVIHLATDHRDYFDVMVGLFRRDARFEEVAPFLPAEAEATDFELLFKGLERSAMRCSFVKRSRPPVDVQPPIDAHGELD